MRPILVPAILVASLVPAFPAFAAEITRTALHQREDVVQQQQRFVGNLRAQAQREGIVVKVPQLYVYFADRSPAWHMQGFKRRFERTLELVYQHGRRERSMVSLERLLERTVSPDGKPYSKEALPEADLYLLLYHRADCEECRQVASGVSDWLDEHEALDVVWFDVWVDRHEAE